MVYLKSPERDELETCLAKSSFLIFQYYIQETNDMSEFMNT